MKSEVDQAFSAGRDRCGSGNALVLAQAHMYGQFLVDQAGTNADYLAAAEQLGYAFENAVRAISIQIRSGDVYLEQELLHIQSDILETTGFVQSKYLTEDSDSSFVAAANLMKKAGRGFIQVGDFRRASIAFTNAAEILLEKSTVDTAEISLIKKYIDIGFKYKEPGTVDWAYSEAVIGMYYERLADNGIGDKINHLELSRAASNRALGLFDEYDEYPSEPALLSISRTERELFHAKRRARRSQAVLGHIDELPEPVRQVAENDPGMVAGNIEVNPATFGFDEVPEWLSPKSEDPLDTEDVEMLLAARERLVSPKKPRVSDSVNRSQLTRMFEAAEISIDLQNRQEAYSEFSALLSEHGDILEPEQIIRRGMTAIGLAEHLGIVPPVPLLLQVADSFWNLIDKRDKNLIEIFLRNNPPLARFVACELCRHEMWDHAIGLIDRTRVVLHANHVSESEYLGTVNPVERSMPQWVYVTHSSRGTYVIIKSDDADVPTTGVFVSELTGSELARLSFSFDYGTLGLTYSQEAGVPMSLLTEATLRAFEILAPVTRAIAALTSRNSGICLIVGGLYTNLPISAALGAENDYPFIAMVLSATTTARESAEITLGNEVSSYAISVPAASGMRVLVHPEREVEVVSRYLASTGIRSSIVHEATKPDLESLFRDANIIHYSGHSFAIPEDPFRSSLALADGPFSVSDLLALDPAHKLFLTTMSSCQSGQPATGVLGDELISLSSAFLYRGCRFAIGTLWPVLDVASYIFFCRFYWAISRQDSLNISAVSLCLVSTQSWIRESTISEMSDFMKANGSQIPDLFYREAASATPFEHPRVWSAYYLAARGL
ncbi:CHAT domain-containing protein [Mycolicibacterium komossense]|uniref:CHAT domain-containing protein n=1 Tax=Mycolicibacterium komossense TaxID=1779 RepID=A0ABT3C5Q9_9MYCO|nr:CHAT domain-containing protein [Mycolicibacterium komossense]MCV7224536.1 CHAT domain-containing protein [Mycolicibacterium komossense]